MERCVWPLAGADLPAVPRSGGVPAHVRCWLAPAATHADPGRGRELPEVLRSQCRSSALLTGRAAGR